MTAFLCGRKTIGCMKKLISFLLAAALLAVSACPLQKEKTVGSFTKALPDDAWDASVWISVVDAPVVTGKVDDVSCRAADGASWFVCDVTNGKKVVSAKWMTAALGVFQLHANGRPVGEEFLKPGFTHPQKTKISFTYDITDAINTKAGAINELSAQVTPGWWADKIVSPANRMGMTGRKCAFRSVLELSYADGTTERFGTDTVKWKAGIAGPVKHAGIFDGEEYDARELPGFLVPELLGAPEVNTEFGGRIFPSAGAEVYLRRDLELRPVEAYVWQGVEGQTPEAFGKVVITKNFKPGKEITLLPGETLVVDFGQNCAGVPLFSFKADEGTVLTCLPSEILNDGNGAKSRGMDGPEGSCHRLNLRIPDEIKAVYTFGKDRGYTSYHPSCTFFGYRYISVTASGKVKIRSVSSIPVSSISRELETGTLATGNELVNKLISNTIWGQRSNYLSVPTDCPQRNERLGWTADTQVFAETGSFFANTLPFFHKWMRDMRDTQSPTGSFPGVAPLAQYGRNMMRLGWADAGIIVPWTVWKQYGDASIIEENWDSMEKFISHVDETCYDHEALKKENGNYQWADWVSYEPLESNGGSAFTRDAAGKRVPLPDAVAYWNYLGACYWALDADMMRDMAAATGRDAAPYVQMAARARKYIRQSFLTPDGRFVTEILNTMQTPVLFALKCGILGAEEKEAVIARLKENFAAHGGCLQTGFLGTSILMETLTENGLSDIAYDLLFQRKNPSWIYSIDNGATTIWERWNSYTKESGMGPKGMNSFNHYAYGCVCGWIWKTAAGIASDPALPGFKHIIMAPVPDRRLGLVEAEYKSAAGLIKSSWRYEGDEWVWQFTVPEGSTATVTLPGETASKDYPAGSYTLRKTLR